MQVDFGNLLARTDRETIWRGVVGLVTVEYSNATTDGKWFDKMIRFTPGSDDKTAIEE
jgi:hypothetical protein